MAHIPKAIETNINKFIDTKVEYLKKQIEDMKLGVHYNMTFPLRGIDNKYTCAEISSKLRKAYPTFYIRSSYYFAEPENDELFYPHWTCDVHVYTRPLWWMRV